MSLMSVLSFPGSFCMSPSFLLFCTPISTFCSSFFFHSLYILTLPILYLLFSILLSSSPLFSPLLSLFPFFIYASPFPPPLPSLISTLSPNPSCPVSVTAGTQGPCLQERAAEQPLKHNRIIFRAAVTVMSGLLPPPPPFPLFSPAVPPHPPLSPCGRFSAYACPIRPHL